MVSESIVIFTIVATLQLKVSSLFFFFTRRMLSEPDISKLNLMTQLSAQTLAPPPGEKQCKSNENSPVIARRHQRNVSKFTEDRGETRY